MLKKAHGSLLFSFLKAFWLLKVSGSEVGMMIFLNRYLHGASKL